MLSVAPNPVKAVAPVEAEDPKDEGMEFGAGLPKDIGVVVVPKAGALLKAVADDVVAVGALALNEKGLLA